MKLNIIEPTLRNQAGHCYGYVKSLIEANHNQLQLTLWVDRQAQNLFKQKNIILRAIFFRPLRKIQTYFLYKKLLSKNEAIFVPTAGQFDCVLLDWIGSKNINTKIFLHFHQYNKTNEKLEKLKALANRNPNWVILAPTEKLLAVFYEAGFKNCHYVPCPVPKHPENKNDLNVQFKKIIYPGAPRSDKGFSELVDFIAFLGIKKDVLPVSVQTSAPPNGKYDEKVQLAFEKLKKINYPYLKLYPNTLTTKEFQELYQNSIALLIYDPVFYADKFSGATLEAFFAHCPIVTVKNTWMGDMAEKYQMGIAISDRDAETIYEAIKKIMENYPQYVRNTEKGAKVLAELHDAKNTLKAICQHFE